MLNLSLKKFLYFTVILLAGNFLLWTEVARTEKPNAGFYFLSVGQGDSELVVFTNGAKVITDAGPGKQVATEAQNVLGTLDNYIDIAVITHPQLDHYGGFAELFSRYDFGIFIVNGREAETATREWQSLMQKIKNKNIPILALGAGDSISLGENKIDILSPNKKLFASKDLNDTGIVEKIYLGELTELLTADLGEKGEKELIKSGVNLKADILKVGHHGSKYSSSAVFLNAISPLVAGIEVGKKNLYGHPTTAVLDRLANVGASVFRTDLLGTFGMKMENGNLVISGTTE